MRILCFIAIALFSGPVIAQDVNAPPADPLVCEKRSNVDTCWQLGIGAEEEDPAAALGHYQRSCDFRSQLAGCYEAARIMLHNRDLRDYDAAYSTFSIVCNSRDIGFGPYACKFMGWMHHTGIGAERDREAAFDLLGRSCFLHNELYFTDSEGCHFLSENILVGPFDAREKQLLAYAALSMGCMDRAEGVCNDAQVFYAAAEADGAAWLDDCEEWLSSMTYRADNFPEAYTCRNFADHTDLVPAGSTKAYDLNRMTRGFLVTIFSALTEAPT